ncbi:MAG: iron ABC transporter permease [Armatimonadetes bacterium]|nr:iron ABC transporter permease [Armatimonadota bacterium]
MPLKVKGLLLVAGLACIFAACVLVGPAAVTASQAWQALWHPQQADETVRAIVWGARLPRVLLAFAVGAALAVAGVIMQSFFQNPMADPSIIGVSSGAALGATLALVTGLASTSSWLMLPGAAFLGAVVAVATVYLLARRAGRTPVALLLLTGIAVAALFSAFSALVMIRAQRGDMDLVVLWMLGSLANRGWTEVAIVWPYVLVATGLAGLFARYLDVLSLGDEQATYLGLPVERVRVGFLALAAVLAGAAVSVTGIIGFIGLVVPHISRLIFGARHRRLLPAAALMGMLTLATADLAANLSGEIPVGIVTAMIGSPFFLWLLRQREVRAA